MGRKVTNHKLLRAMVVASMTSTDLASKARISLRTVTNLLAKHGTPRPVVIAAVCAALGRDAYALGLSDQKPRKSVAQEVAQP